MYSALKRHEKYLKNKEHENAYSRRYQKSHREELRISRKEYRATEEGKEATLRAIRKYEATHPERKNAWNKAQKLTRKPCVKCGKYAHKHHPDPAKPLEVIFLCPLHHKEAHMQIQ